MAALDARGESNNGKLQRKIASIISGSASGAVVSLALQPLDVIRTQLQAQAVAAERGSARTLFTTAKDVWLTGGIGNFWRGSGPTVWRLSVGLGIQFLTLETLTDALLSRRATGRTDLSSLDHKSRELGKLEAFFAGGLARGVAAAATVPFTLAKTRMEYQGPNAQVYKGTFSVLGGIVKKEGVAGIFRGIGPTILTNAPFSALYYMFYSDLKRRLQPEGKTSSLVNFTSGTIAAVAATLLTQPTDMIRTQMQLGTASNAKLGSVALLRQIVASRGMGVLLAGAAPRVLKRTLQTALVWTIYEELKPFLMQQAQKFSGEQQS